jgi:syntaxin-binding protein 1
MDDHATRIISSALTMYDIMERRVTIVEQLKINRQAFPEMDVIYLCAPTMDAARKISADFESRHKAKYGNVHLFFLNAVGADVFGVIQSNSLLVSKVKTFKEISFDFLSVESSVFHLDLTNSLDMLYGVSADSTFPAMLGRKLVNLCVTLNEHPCIRYQGSSPFSRDIATSLHQGLLAYKRSNPAFWCYGDDKHTDRERAQILILDRSFDPLSPLMHEYTYQAMVNDLLDVTDGVISYKAMTNKGVEEEKQAILNENDEFWLELRHQHIAKVIEVIKDRMNDIIQNNSGAQLAKQKGGEMNITSMAAAIKQLPEYTQTMTKLGQHVSVAQQCMDAFSRQGLMNLSQIEQTISTGMDEEGKEIKGQKLFQLVSDALRAPLSRDQKVRLLAVYFVAQRNIAGSEEFIRQAFQVARLNNSDQQIVTNFERILACSQAPAAGAGEEKKPGGVFSSLFGGKAPKHAATPEGEYADTRHVCLLKSHLEQLCEGNLALDKFPAMGPSVATGPKSEAKSVRKFAATSKFGKKDNVPFSGGRVLVFIAGGAAYAELRTAYEIMQAQKKEIVIGSTHLTSPENYLIDVASLHTASTTVSKREDLL